MKDLTFSRRMAEVNSSRVSIRVMFSISISADVSIEDFSIVIRAVDAGTRVARFL
jgi:hypothetical protein